MDNETCTCQKLHARHLLQTTVLCAWGGKVWLKLRGSVICAASTDLTIPCVYLTHSAARRHTPRDGQTPLGRVKEICASRRGVGGWDVDA